MKQTLAGIEEEFSQFFFRQPSNLEDLIKSSSDEKAGVETDYSKLLKYISPNEFSEKWRAFVFDNIRKMIQQAYIFEMGFEFDNVDSRQFLKQAPHKYDQYNAMGSAKNRK